jgi:hypothetical protein
MCFGAASRGKSRDSFVHNCTASLNWWRWANPLNYQDPLSNPKLSFERRVYLGSESRFKAGKIVWLLLVPPCSWYLTWARGHASLLPKEPNFLVYHREFEKTVVKTSFINLSCEEKPCSDT